MRSRSKSDTPMRDESHSTPPYNMTHMQDLENNDISILEVQSDLNINGGEYRPRSSSNTSTSSRGRPPPSHQKIQQVYSI
jgi:hypothetical protein